MLRRRARRRSGARARQPRRVHLPASPSTTATPATARSLERLWPHVASGGRLHRRAAPQRRTPEYRAPDKPRVLRPAAAVDQPRGLLGQADALVLGRLLRAARAEGRGVPRRRARATARRRARSPRSATSSAHDLVRVDRARDGDARHRLHPRRRRARRLRRDVDDDRARARRRARDTCRAAALPRTFERYWQRVRRAARRHAALGRLHAVRAAHASARSSGSAGATARTSCCDCFFARPPPGGAGTSGRRSSWRDPRERRGSSATCRTPGSARTSSARALDLFAYEREADSALVVGAGVPRGVGERSRRVACAASARTRPARLEMRADRRRRARPIVGGSRALGRVPRALAVRPVRRATVNGAAAAIPDGAVRVARPRGRGYWNTDQARENRSAVRSERGQYAGRLDAPPAPGTRSNGRALTRWTPDMTREPTGSNLHARPGHGRRVVGRGAAGRGARPPSRASRRAGVIHRRGRGSSGARDRRRARRGRRGPRASR